MANAVANALASFGAMPNQLPLSPPRVWRMGPGRTNPSERCGMSVDRFGNPHAPNLSYAHGEILRSTEDDFQNCSWPGR